MRRGKAPAGAGRRQGDGRARAAVAVCLAVPLAWASVACTPERPAVPEARSTVETHPADTSTTMPTAGASGGATSGGSATGTTATPEPTGGSGPTAKPGSTDAPATPGTPATPGKAQKPKKPARPTPVPSVDRPRASSVSLTSDARPAPGITAHLLTLENVTGVAEGPGEIAGKAVRVTVELVNGTNDALDLRGAVVNLYTGTDKVPTSVLSGSGSVALPATLPADGTARATYVFRTDDRDGHLEVEVDIADAPTIVAFAGTR